MQPKTFEVYEFITMLRSRGVHLSVAGDKVQIAAPPETSREIIEQIRLQKSAIIRHLTADFGSPPQARIFTPPGERQGIDSSSPSSGSPVRHPPKGGGEPSEPPRKSLGDQKKLCWEERESDPYWMAAHEALTLIDEAAPWPGDLSAWLALHYPDVHRILFTTLPEEIDRIWNERAGIEPFTAALGRWVQTHHDALALRRKWEQLPRT
jgi:hypothetical protein